MGNVQVVKDVYQRFGRGDVSGVLAIFDPSVEWRLAEGHPYDPEGKGWSGPDAIRRNFFMRAGGEWDGFAVSARVFHDAGDTIVVECRYAGVHKATGKRLDAQVCHVWKVSDSKIKSFQQYIDTAQLRKVMGTR
jgi:uncharacterized protein